MVYLFIFYCFAIDKQKEITSMNSSNNKTKKLLMATIIVLVILIVSMIVIFAAVSYFSRSGRRVSHAGQEELMTESSESEELTESDDDFIVNDLPSKTVFAIYGVDKGEALSDVIIVASFDKIKNTINTISIPRDTYVEMSENNRKELKEKGRNVPSGGMKINAVHSFAGKYGNEYLSRQLEEMLGIHIDYYFEVNLEAFNKIVDTVGGIEIDVPTNMYYRDPTQNLYINIKKGPQVMDGETAQGFVRFRQYFTGDIQRIEMQKLFLQALMRKITNTETFLSNLPELVEIFIENTETNMTIRDAVEYAPYIKNISLEKLTMETLPGDGNTPYNIDKAKTRTLVNKLFFDVKDYSETESELEMETEY